jgi:hypothetical protein
VKREKVTSGSGDILAPLFEPPISRKVTWFRHGSGSWFSPFSHTKMEPKLNEIGSSSQEASGNISVFEK